MRALVSTCGVKGETREKRKEKEMRSKYSEAKKRDKNRTPRRDYSDLRFVPRKVRE